MAPASPGSPRVPRARAAGRAARSAARERGVRGAAAIRGGPRGRTDRADCSGASTSAAPRHRHSRSRAWPLRETNMSAARAPRAFARARVQADGLREALLTALREDLRRDGRFPRITASALVRLVRDQTTLGQQLLGYEDGRRCVA